MFGIPRRKTHRRRSSPASYKKFVVVASIVVLVVLGTYTGFVFLVSSDAHRIDTIRIEGERFVREDQVQDVVRQKIQGTHFIYIPNNSRFTYPKSEVKSLVIETFSEFDDVGIRFEKPNTLVITVNEFDSAYIFCGEGGDARPGDLAYPELCQYVDNRGIAFGEAPYFSDGVYFKLADNRNNKPVVVGEEVFESEELRNVLQFRELLDAAGYAPYRGERQENSDAYMYVEQLFGEDLRDGTFIKFEVGDDPETIFESLALVSSVENFSNKFSAHSDRLQYIDVRFLNKIVYKFDEDV